MLKDLVQEKYLFLSERKGEYTLMQLPVRLVMSKGKNYLVWMGTLKHLFLTSGTCSL